MKSYLRAFLILLLRFSSCSFLKYDDLKACIDEHCVPQDRKWFQSGFKGSLKLGSNWIMFWVN